MLRRLKLSRVPRFQIFVGSVFLPVTYRVPRRTEIVIEGMENLPRDRTVFLAMNHTDMYNYWPFQYGIWKRGFNHFTSTWVKGKYFENVLLRQFLLQANNIPLPSRGYVISTEFRASEKRAPAAAEYRVLRDYADGARDDLAGGGDAVKRFVEGGGLERFEQSFRAMMQEVVRITSESIGPLGHDVLVFPQGTRSKRLSKGHLGLAQVAQHLGKAIVPVGCSGSDKLYPGGSPWSKGGRVVYRVGTPLEPDGPELSPHRVATPFVPLVPETAKAHGTKFRAITDVVMQRIDALLDPEYRFAAGGASDGVQEMSRFL